MITCTRKILQSYPEIPTNWRRPSSTDGDGWRRRDDGDMPGMESIWQRYLSQRDCLIISETQAHMRTQTEKAPARCNTALSLAESLWQRDHGR